MFRIGWYGAEETSDPETLAVQGSQGDRRRRAAGGWAGGANRERASEGHRADRFGHRRLSPQHRPCRWPGRPQHSGDDQNQDRAAGLNALPGVAYRSSSSLSFWRLAATASRTRGTATRPSRRPGPRRSSSTAFATRVPSGMASRTLRRRTTDRPNEPDSHRPERLSRLREPPNKNREWKATSTTR